MQATAESRDAAFIMQPSITINLIVVKKKQEEGSNSNNRLFHFSVR